ncbi:hypothetical protein CYD53_11563 [Bosea psychrotolerans]|uniref:Uncharacterized protein n=1 Tax=Bosea psychrotolerans TaxID=1871628 RepID=A0A2S4M111_9HYPH|nr:hypothetical protein CYD53_11563 [Bosea psychrotolerans]
MRTVSGLPLPFCEAPERDVLLVLAQSQAIMAGQVARACRCGICRECQLPWPAATGVKNVSCHFAGAAFSKPAFAMKVPKRITPFG